MTRRFGMCIALLGMTCLLTAASSMADEEAEKSDKKPAAEKKFTAKCPISGHAAKEDMTADYKDKKVYLCCGDCKKAFEEDSSQYAVKANHQLVQTKQYRQTKCPFSGGDIKKETVVRVAKVPVRFCCDNCKGKAEAKKGDEQIALIFSEDAFKKAFVARKAKKSDDKKKKSDT